jgi:hypothetical protein
MPTSQEDRNDLSDTGSSSALDAEVSPDRSMGQAGTRYGTLESRV